MEIQPQKSLLFQQLKLNIFFISILSLAYTSAKCKNMEGEGEKKKSAVKSHSDIKHEINTSLKRIY